MRPSPIRAEYHRCSSPSSRAADGQRHRGEREHEDQLRVLLRDRIVEEGPEEERRDDRDARTGDDGEHEADQELAVRPRQPEHTAHELALDPVSAHAVRVVPEAHPHLVHRHVHRPT